jgi:hypothetical protein
MNASLGAAFCLTLRFNRNQASRTLAFRHFSGVRPWPRSAFREKSRAYRSVASVAAFLSRGSARSPGRNSRRFTRMHSRSAIRSNRSLSRAASRLSGGARFGTAICGANWRLRCPRGSGSAICRQVTLGTLRFRIPSRRSQGWFRGSGDRTVCSSSGRDPPSAIFA